MRQEVGFDARTIRNQELARRLLHAIVGSFVFPNYPARGVRFYDRHDPYHRIQLMVAGDEEEARRLCKEEGFVSDYLPKQITYPVISFQELRRSGSSEWVSVPYGTGVLPEAIIASDGNSYIFSNVLVLDLAGKAGNVKLYKKLSEELHMLPTFIFLHHVRLTPDWFE